MPLYIPAISKKMPVAYHGSLPKVPAITECFTPLSLEEFSGRYNEG
jgi:hypothetical protein